MRTSDYNHERMYERPQLSSGLTDVYYSFLCKCMTGPEKQNYILTSGNKTAVPFNTFPLENRYVNVTVKMEFFKLTVNVFLSYGPKKKKADL